LEISDSPNINLGQLYPCKFKASIWRI